MLMTPARLWYMRLHFWLDVPLFFDSARLRVVAGAVMEWHFSYSLIGQRATQVMWDGAWPTFCYPVSLYLKFEICQTL